MGLRVRFVGVEVPFGGFGASPLPPWSESESESLHRLPLGLFRRPWSFSGPDMVGTSPSVSESESFNKLALGFRVLEERFPSASSPSMSLHMLGRWDVFRI